MSKRYGRIVDGLVVEIWESPSDELTPDKVFHIEIANAFEAIGDDVQQNWMRDQTGKFVASHVPEPPPKKRRVPAGLLLSRILDAGKADEAFAALMARPKLFLRLIGGTDPSVEFDDVDVVAFVRGVGLKPADLLNDPSPPRLLSARPEPVPSGDGGPPTPTKA